jgi:hypothetical protein
MRQEGDPSHKCFKHDILNGIAAASPVDIQGEGCPTAQELKC